MSYIEQPLQGVPRGTRRVAGQTTRLVTALGSAASEPPSNTGAGLARNVGVFPPGEWQKDAVTCKQVPDGRLVSEVHEVYVGGPKKGIDPAKAQDAGCVPSGRGGEWLGRPVPYWCCPPPVAGSGLPATVPEAGGTTTKPSQWGWLGLLLGAVAGYLGYRWLSARREAGLPPGSVRTGGRRSTRLPGGVAQNPRSGRSWKLLGGGEVMLDKSLGSVPHRYDVSYRYEGGHWYPVGDVTYDSDKAIWIALSGEEVDRFRDLDDAIAFVVREAGFQQKVSGPVPLFALPERDERSRRANGRARNPEEGTARARTVYLAVMPRKRKAKAIGSVEAGWYRQHAAKFYEVTGPGMTAEKARRMIAAGEVQPSWEGGRPVEELPENTVATLDELFDITDEWMSSGSGMHTTRLWLGHEQWIPIFEGHRPGARWKYVYHKMGSHPALYHEEPMTGGDLQKAIGRHVRLDLMVEDYAHGSRESEETRPWRVVDEWHLHGKLNRQHLGW